MIIWLIYVPRTLILHCKLGSYIFINLFLNYNHLMTLRLSYDESDIFILKLYENFESIPSIYVTATNGKTLNHGKLHYQL